MQPSPSAVMSETTLTPYAKNPPHEPGSGEMLPRKSGMVTRFSLFVRIVYAWLYARIVHEPSQIKEILSIPASEPIVYLLNSENKLDFLYLNSLCLQTGMPTAYVSNGSSKRRYGSLGSRLRAFLGRYNQTDGIEEILEAIRSGRPALIFLNQYGHRETDKQRLTETLLSRLMELSQKTSLRIHLVPVGVIWERRAENYNHTFLNEIYGTPTRPSSVRRFLSALPGLFQLFLKIGQPQCLIHNILLTGDAPYENGIRLRQALIDEIDQMHTQVNGPKVKSHHRLMREILDHEAFRSELRSIGQSTGQSEAELLAQARKILEKTSSKFSFVMVKLLCTILTPLFALIYNGLYFDPEKLNELRELSKTNRLIFIPSHKSHIDYLVLSVVMFQHGLMPPHIAAGENLNFAIVGGILRRGGAFFIKRSFRGELLYTACLKHYIAKILDEGYPIEFFIEGGRSRTGQVLQPKFGILRMIAQAVQTDPTRPVKIIPCAITYEKVIEDLAYKKEQEGASKHKESITGLIKTTRLLISKYGQLYVSFAEPIDFNAALTCTDETAANHAEETFTKQVDVLAGDIMQRINQASTITTSSLLSVSILNETARRLPLSQVLETAAFFLNLLVERNALISPVLTLGLAASRASLRALTEDGHKVCTNQSPSQIESISRMLHDPIVETLKLFEKNGSLHIHNTQTPPEVEIASSGRLQMAFYKNILLFAIIDDIYFAFTVQTLKDKEFTRDAAERVFVELSDILNLEFSLSQPYAVFDDTIRRFIARGWIRLSDDGTIIPLPEGTLAIRNLSRCLTPHIQSYTNVFKAAAHMEDTLAENALIQRIMEDSEEAVKNSALLPESRSKVMFSHAVNRLIRLGCFRATYDSSAKKPVKLLTRVKPIPSNCLFSMEP